MRSSESWQLLKKSLKGAFWATPVIVTFNDCVAGSATVHGRSMRPTLNPSDESNDRIIVGACVSGVVQTLNRMH
jgi:signal peptidase I